MHVSTAIVFCALFGCLGYVIKHESGIESPERLTPELRIEVKNGVTDTTFIYKPD